MQHHYDVLLETLQDDCPIPTLKAKAALDAMEPGAVLKLVAGAEGTIRNIRTFARSSGYELLGESREGSVFSFFIKKPR
jgi:TusA-related sulfurtransferase